MLHTELHIQGHVVFIAPENQNVVLFHHSKSISLCGAALVADVTVNSDLQSILL